MVAGPLNEEKEAKVYNGRVTTYVILSCTAAAMGGLLFGYDIGISGGVTSMEPFLKKFFPRVYRKQKDAGVSNYCKFDSHLLTAFTSSLYIAGLISSLLASSVTRSRGRKPSILVAAVAFLAGALVGGAAANVYMIILGRLLLGVGVGFANQSVPLYLSEMAPPRLRGAISNGFQFSIGWGVLAANLINYGVQKIKAGWGWRVSLSAAGVPAVILFFGALFLPETPNSLAQRCSDPTAVKLLLQKIRGTTDVDKELDDIITAADEGRATSSPSSPFRLILLRRYRPHLAMAIAIPFFQQATGINIIAFYAPLIFRTIGLGESGSLMSAVVTGVTGLTGTFVSMIFVDQIGRRVLFMIGGVQMLVSQCIVGGILAAELHDEGTVSRGIGILVLVLICVFVTGFSWSWGPLGWLVPSEIFPLEVRSAGQSIVVVVNFVFTFIIAQTFLAMLCSFKAGTFFFFAGWVLVMTMFVYLFLPETKMVPLEQMDVVWKEHWFWKKMLDI